ncbi:MAG: glycosyl transferase, partial [Epsilonproteobacteria bacterium]
MNFSVLISIYYKENPSYLEEALTSLEQQSLLPNEIVLVKDGPLTPDLDRLILQHQEQSVIPYKIIALAQNVGLGIALNKG